jgi:hypothetical protein
MNKILKNTTISTIFVLDTGVSIPGGFSYEIPQMDYLLWASSTEVVPLITSGDLIVNNGSVDLSASDGVRYLQYPERITIKDNGSNTSFVTSELDFTGSVSVTNSGNGKATIQVNGSSSSVPCLREVQFVLLGGSIPVNTESNLLFEPDPTNSVIKFMREEVIS